MQLLFIIGCFTVFPFNTFPPSIEKVSPSDGVVVNYGDNVLFTIDIADPDSSMKDITIRIESNVDGLLVKESPGDNGKLNQSVADLSVGEHQLMISVTDSEDNSVSQSTTLVVNDIPSSSGWNRSV